MSLKSIMPPASQQRLDITQTTEVKCDKCENVVFVEGMFMRRASALLTGAAKDAYVPIPTFYCASCGSVNDEFIPPELKSKIKLV